MEEEKNVMIQIPVKREDYYQLLKLKTTNKSWYEFFKIDKILGEASK